VPLARTLTRTVAPLASQTLLFSLITLADVTQDIRWTRPEHAFSPLATSPAPAAQDLLRTSASHAKPTPTSDLMALVFARNTSTSFRLANVLHVTRPARTASVLPTTTALLADQTRLFSRTASALATQGIIKILTLHSA
jgi:hypothetical protein